MIGSGDSGPAALAGSSKTLRGELAAQAASAVKEISENRTGTTKHEVALIGTPSHRGALRLVAFW